MTSPVPGNGFKCGDKEAMHDASISPDRRNPPLIGSILRSGELSSAIGGTLSLAVDVSGRAGTGTAGTMTALYTLPDLPYSYDALAPWCPAETLHLHHGKHHATYVKEANAAAQLLTTIDPSDEAKLGAAQSALAFNLSGHLMHSLFWESLTPKSSKPSADFAGRVKADFGSIDRFKTVFTSACVKLQGSGWGALVIDPATGAMRVGSILNHNNNVIPGSQLVAVLDVWEHAYYLTYKNDRPTWVGAAIDHLNWDAIEQRCHAAMTPVAQIA